MSVPISAAILAGGKSRRMGSDKANLTLPGQGRLIDVSIERLRAVADDIIIVANDERFTELGLRTVSDQYPKTGPLGGIYTALVAARHERCLVVACDMPFLSVPLLQGMADRAFGTTALIPRIGGFPEPLHAIYRRSCIREIEPRLHRGQLKIIDFIASVDVDFVDDDELRQFDPTLRSFVNVNTPAEWKTALAQYERELSM